MKEVCTNAPFRFDMHYKKETGFITIRWDPSFFVYIRIVYLFSYWKSTL